MLALINPSPLVLIVAMTMGIVLHDMHIEKVAIVATLPNSAKVSTSEKLSAEKLATSGEKVITPTYHTHVERASVPTSTFRSTLPNMRQARDDQRQYIQNRKLILSGGDAMSLWPSA